MRQVHPIGNSLLFFVVVRCSSPSPAIDNLCVVVIENGPTDLPKRWWGFIESCKKKVVHRGSMKGFCYRDERSLILNPTFWRFSSPLPHRRCE